MDLSGFQGYIKKDATILSNDPASSRMVVVVEGTVKPLVWVLPEKSVSFQGMALGLKEKVVDLKATSKVFHIGKMSDNLEKKATYKLETVEEGKHYRLILSNNTKRGVYRGSITLRTDLSEKPDLTVWVNGNIEGEIGIRPKTLIVGRLSPDQGVIGGEVLITDNLNKAFKILGYTYDERVLNVIQSPLPGNAGFSLKVTPKMENIPAGGRLQTKLTIETDVASEGKQEVQVQAINLSDGG